MYLSTAVCVILAWLLMNSWGDFKPWQVKKNSSNFSSIQHSKFLLDVMGFFCRLSGVLFHSRHAETVVYLLCLVSCLARHSHRWLVAIELSHLIKKKIWPKDKYDWGCFFFFCVLNYTRFVPDETQIRKNKPTLFVENSHFVPCVTFCM